MTQPDDSSGSNDAGPSQPPERRGRTRRRSWVKPDASEETPLVGNRLSPNGWKLLNNLSGRPHETEVRDRLKDPEAQHTALSTSSRGSSALTILTTAGELLTELGGMAKDGMRELKDALSQMDRGTRFLCSLGALTTVCILAGSKLVADSSHFGTLPTLTPDQRTQLVEDLKTWATTNGSQT